MEAVRDALAGLATPTVALKVVYAGLGPITEADVNLAKATGAALVAFSLRPPSDDIATAIKEEKIPVSRQLCSA